MVSSAAIAILVGQSFGLRPHPQQYGFLTAVTALVPASFVGWVHVLAGPLAATTALTATHLATALELH